MPNRLRGVYAMISINLFKFSRLSVLSLITLISMSAANAKVVNTPVDLHGVWSQTTPTGHEQCIAYRKHRSQEHLVGAVLIDKKKIIDVAEYGENDEYELTKIKPLGYQIWRINALANIYPQEKQAQKSVRFTFAIKKKKLYWTSEYLDNGKQTQKTWVYFRCI